MKALALLFLLTTPIAFAKDKPVYSYQDGVFQSLRTEQTGRKCSSDADTNGTVNANTDTNGNTNGTVRATTTGSTTFQDTQRTLYTVKVAENTFVLTPAESGKGMAAGFATLGWSRVFAKNNVLAYQLPGSPIKIRSDGKHLLREDRRPGIAVLNRWSRVSVPDPCPEYARLESLLESRRKELNFYHPVNVGRHGPANQAKKSYKETETEIVKLQTMRLNHAVRSAKSHL